ncbi:MAG TPA: HlyD family efflux transporter periplasmic adaptor subunit [Hyphomicrobiales bacterium]|nr:HlyD family efflux transporter periplasmic adaptor subunit [Hyphomicrobiales bacterium]
MDIPRKISRWPRRLGMAGGVLLGLMLLTLSWHWLAAGLFSSAVQARELVIGRVQRTELIRDVRAPGVLVPVELRWIASRVEGRVENILVEAGAHVMPGTVIMELSNPTVARDADTARIELEVLNAEALVLEKRTLNDLLAQQAVVAEYEALYENARFRMEANRGLGDIVSRVDLNESVLLARQYEDRLAFEKQRLAHYEELREAELQASKANIARAQRQLDLHQELLSGLSVTAGIEGTLQDVPVEAGQLISTGMPLARVAREDRFKTELRVQEGQARELRTGQKAQISAGGRHVMGIVSRIDPAVQEGTVLVDVSFTSEPLPGARPDLRVQGVIEIDRIDDALVLPRPVYSQENSTSELFVLSVDGRSARRAAVELGLGSVDRIQVLGGVNEGERVVVSDMSRYGDADSIALQGVQP